MVSPDKGKPRILSAIERASIGDKIDIDGDPAYLLVDTRRFSQFSITEVEMEHIYGTGPVSNPSVPSGTMRVKLIDTTGLTFFNFLSDVLRNKLKTTRASAFFLLTIVFVGHRHDGTTETISTCNIPLILLLMGFKFSSSGTVFDIEFMETEGSAQRGMSFEQINNCGYVRSATTKGGPPTVGQMALNFEKQLNIRALEFYQKYQNSALSETEKANSSRAGKLVQYMITLPNSKQFNWADGFKITVANPSQHQEQYFIAGGEALGQNELLGIGAQNSFAGEPEEEKEGLTQSSNGKEIDYTLSFSKNASIADVLKKILESSEDFLKLAGQKSIEANNGLTCKIVTNITSDKNTYLIHYDIYPVTIPKAVTGPKTGATATGLSVNGLNLLNYDYIFTGKNSHIKDLDIIYKPESAVALDTEVDIGVSRHKRIAESGNTKAGVKAAEKGSAKSSDTAFLLRPNDPIFPPEETSDQQKNNNSNRKETATRDEAIESFRVKQEYVRSLAFFHFVSSLDLEMTIRGNPNIMRKYADREERGGVAPHGNIIDTKVLESLNKQKPDSAGSNYSTAIAERLNTAKKQYYEEYYQPRLQKITTAQPRPNDSLLGNGDIVTSPIFVKLNIRAPNVDNLGAALADGPMFTDQFFYDGPYMVLFVKHSLINGEFTQTLSLIPFDINGKFSTSGDAP
jgi:hypothetical protein